MIKMQIIGHLGKDCVVNTVNGKSVINFTVANTEKYKDAQGVLQEKTTWVDCGYWTDRTAIAPYLQKGTQVYVEGQPEAKSFQRSDGTPGATLHLRVREVQLLGSSKNQNSGVSALQSQPASTSNAPSSSEVSEPVDDLPF